MASYTLSSCAACLCMAYLLRPSRRQWQSYRQFSLCKMQDSYWVQHSDLICSANFILIAATVIALPIGRSGQRNDAKYIFGTTSNLTTWTPGFAWFLSWLSPIWTIGAFDSCVHMSEEASNATKVVPYGILMR